MTEAAKYFTIIVCYIIAAGMSDGLDATAPTKAKECLWTSDRDMSTRR